MGLQPERHTLLDPVTAPREGPSGVNCELVFTIDGENQNSSLTGAGLNRKAGYGQSSTDIAECGSSGDAHQIRINDPRKGEILPDGHVGEIWVAGPSKGMGYWRHPEESRATFQARLPGDAHSSVRTGELGLSTMACSLPGESRNW